MRSGILLMVLSAFVFLRTVRRDGQPAPGYKDGRTLVDRLLG